MKRKHVSPLRANGQATELGRSGECMRCGDEHLLVAASTNQGYIHICRKCFDVGIRNSIGGELPPYKGHKRSNKDEDAMLRRTVGSFGSGKRR
jgi:hypothetical protein